MGLSTPLLHTERLVLRPLTESDAAALFALHSDRRVVRYWDSPAWTEPERAAAFLARTRQMGRDGVGVRWAVEPAGDPTFLGWASLSQWSPAFRSAEVGYCFGEQTWGRGFATEALGAILGWAYATLDLNRVQAEVDTRNVASARVLEKNGFIREGTLRQDCIVDGVVSDTWIYGLLRGDRPQDRQGSV